MTSQRSILIGLVTVTILLSLVPFFQVALQGEYRGVPPPYVDDDLYYYARMREVADGKPFLGNPYFLEHADAPPVTFSITDWIAAAPLLVGASLTTTIIFNQVFWAIVFVLLAYLIARIVALSAPGAASIALFAYLEVYWMVLRPVIMQEVFPFFLVFIAIFLLWLRNASSGKLSSALAIISAAAFYVYGFLWQIIFCILAVTFIVRLAQKRWSDVRMLILSALGTAVLAGPILIYSIQQFSAPAYWEAFARIGLVRTHLPAVDTYHYGRWMVVLVLMAYLIRRWFDSPPREGFLLLGVGLIITAMSALFTGQDIATGQHVGRFITLVVALFFPILLGDLWNHRRMAFTSTRWKVGVISVLVISCAVFLGVNLERSLPFLRNSAPKSAALQGYASPLLWLEQHESVPRVIFTNDELSLYVPILTKHSVLWNHAGSLYVMPTREAEDRFLISRPMALTRQQIIDSLEAFDGAGIERRYEDMYLKGVVRCWFRIACDAAPTREQWFGVANIDRLVARQQELRKDIRGGFKRYNVTYIVVDTRRTHDLPADTLKDYKKVWSNEHFIIYKVI